MANNNAAARGLFCAYLNKLPGQNGEGVVEFEIVSSMGSWRVVPSFYRILRNQKQCVGSTHLHGRRLSLVVEPLFDYERDQPHDGGIKSDKDATLNNALSQLQVAGYFDKQSQLWLSRFFLHRYTQVVSTGSLKLDIALGIGGLPKGKIVEIYGKEASGKTTLALHIIKEIQKHGGRCAYIDAENAIDPSLLDAMGINIDRLLFTRSDCAENTLSIVNTLASSGAVDVIVVDSVAALLPQYNLKNEIGSRYTDMLPQLLTQALRKIHASLNRSQTLVIFINQMRSHVRKNNMQEVTCGGNALKFYAAMRLRTATSCLLQTNSQETTGIRISVKVMKNKLAPIVKDAAVPAIEDAYLDIEFGKGICHEAEVLELASKHDLISKKGNCFRVYGKFLGNRVKAERYLTENACVMDDLVRMLRKKLFNIES